MLARRRTGPDSVFLHRRWPQKLSIKVQLLNPNLVAMSMPYVDAYDTRLATRNLGASIRRPVVIRESQTGSHTRSVARNVLAVIATVMVWESGARASEEERGRV
jgi:hypothetical protein